MNALVYVDIDQGIRGLVSILKLGERKNFLPNKGRLIDKIFEILLSKSQKLGGATTPLAPPLTRALIINNNNGFFFAYPQPQLDVWYHDQPIQLRLTDHLDFWAH